MSKREILSSQAIVPWRRFSLELDSRIKHIFGNGGTANELAWLTKKLLKSQGVRARIEK
jgi:hypothetical protein